LLCRSAGPPAAPELVGLSQHERGDPALELPDEPGLTMTAYSAEPGTPSADNLALLASWAAINIEAAPAKTSANEH
jgi:hypothetical protein